MNATKTKLSPRAWEVLLVIDERSNLEDGRFFCPMGSGRGCDDWCERLGYFCNLGDSSDAAIIRSLANKGLIKMKALVKYACQITEDGRLLIERSLESGSIPLKLKD